LQNGICGGGTRRIKKPEDGNLRLRALAEPALPFLKLKVKFFVQVRQAQKICAAFGQIT
jgi:hypothetical protein